MSSAKWRQVCLGLNVLSNPKYAIESAGTKPQQITKRWKLCMVCTEYRR